MTDPTLPPVWTRTGVPAQRPYAEDPATWPGQGLPDRSYVATAPTPPPVRVETEEAYAHWGLRVAATLIDMLLQVPFAIAQLAGILIAFDSGAFAVVEGGATAPDELVVLPAQISTGTWVGLALAGGAGFAGLIFSIWNTFFRQGRRGATIGKQCMNLMVVSGTDGRPIGTFLTFVRYWAHLLDAVPLAIGYLWPLWDRKRQTFADMAMNTVVLHLPPLPRTPQVVQAQVQAQVPVQVPAQSSAPYGW